MSDDTKIKRTKLRQLLREIREKSGVHQVDLAKKLCRPQSFVSKYETGEKTLDFVEVEEVCNALNVPFKKLVKQYEDT